MVPLEPEVNDKPMRSTSGFIVYQFLYEKV